MRTNIKIILKQYLKNTRMMKNINDLIDQSIILKRAAERLSFDVKEI